MVILWAFAPFILFAVVQRWMGASAGLISAAVVSGGILIRDWIKNRTMKVLDIGAVILFAGLAALESVNGASWSIIGVRLRVDLGLLVVVVASIAVRQPFTLQYARALAPKEIWNTPEFIRANYVITAVWALAFVVMVLADLVMLYAPSVPAEAAIVATVVALIGAIRFTSWYPEYIFGASENTALLSSGGKK